MTYDVSWAPHGDTVVVALGGEIDLAAVPDIRAALATVLGGGSTDVVVDLTAVTFLDSTGLGALVGARSRAVAAGGALRLVASGRGATRVLRLTRLDTVFDVSETLDEALGRKGS